MKLTRKHGMLGLLLAGFLTSLSGGTGDIEDLCGRIALDKDCYDVGESGVLILQGPPGLVPLLFVSPDPRPVESSPFQPRRLPKLTEEGLFYLESAPFTCESVDKYLQVALLDPYSKKLVCYTNEVYLKINRRYCQEEAEGCTPGYWKQDQHFDSWPAGYAPDMLFAYVFEDAFPGMTLLEVLQNGGGGLDSLGRHTVAALLNAESEVDSPMSHDEVIQIFDGVYPGEKSDYNEMKDFFEGMNEAGCPLN